MSGLLKGKRGCARETQPGCVALFVDGQRHVNTAAKFWPALFDEVEAEVPGCRSVVLTAPAADPLGADSLHPEKQFEEAIQHLWDADFAEAMRSTIAEMEMLGPPPRVGILLVDDKGGELLAQDLPEECIDADILTYLTAWLLHWAGVPEGRWNDASVEAGFAGEDRQRRWVYRIDFVLAHAPMAEGLVFRTLTLTPRRDTWPDSEA